ncbi:MAG TPA: DUF4157 domain-containing protein [Myxococcota bacterium]|nr:DUF4157 domain-containing protein [Myxococcota bacterium]
MRVHEGAAGAARALRAGNLAITQGRDVYLSPWVGAPGMPTRSEVLRHERVHVAQVEVGRSSPRASRADLERQASRLQEGAAEPILGADPTEEYGFWPLLAGAGACLYILLRPNVANAPGPGDVTHPSVPLTQVAGEAVSIFLLPEFILARTGLTATGLMLVGASSNVGVRASGDLGRGRVSSPSDYLIDAGSGALMGRLGYGPASAFSAGVRGLPLLRAMGLSGMGMGATVLGTHDLHAGQMSGPEQYARYIGGGGILGLSGAGLILGGDRLAGRLVYRSDAARGVLSEGLDAEQVSALFASTRPDRWGSVGEAWLNSRGLEQFYRGQTHVSERILSPFNRERMGLSEEMYNRYIAAGETPETLAGATARWNDQPVWDAIPGLDPRMGATGIPVTRNPAVAADFARTGGGTLGAVSTEGKIYIIQLPKGRAINAGPVGWPEKSPVELEFIVLHEIPASAIVGRVPAPDALPSLFGEGGVLVPRPTP